jgi:hypothetical protein
MDALRKRLIRVIGAGSAAYGVSLLVVPRSLAWQTGMRDGDDAAMRLLAVTFGVRDLVCGLAILRARDRDALRTALLVRGLMDGGDAIACASLLTDPGARARVTTVAGVWGAVSLALAATT